MKPNFLVLTCLVSSSDILPCVFLYASSSTPPRHHHGPCFYRLTRNICIPSNAFPHQLQISHFFFFNSLIACHLLCEEIHVCKDSLIFPWIWCDVISTLCPDAAILRLEFCAYLPVSSGKLGIQLGKGSVHFHHFIHLNLWLQRSPETSRGLMHRLLLPIQSFWCRRSGVGWLRHISNKPRVTLRQGLRALWEPLPLGTQQTSVGKMNW